MNVTLAVAVLLTALSALTADEAPKKGQAKKVEMTGTLKTGIFAIGGETTGTIIQTKKEGSFELDFGKNKELRALAERLDGKQVTVTGTLTIRAGVEIRKRRIIAVETMKEAK
jgi:hypothetical protein